MGDRMNRTLRSILIFVLTLVVLLAVFYLVLPPYWPSLHDQFGASTTIVVLVGSLILSYVVSWILGHIIR